MHVDGDETKTPEKTAPFKSKVCDHANRAIILMQKVVHGKAPQYLKDLMIPSERLHVHGNNSFCSEQGLVALKRVSPFQAP